jgi:putative flippase GtrA
MTRLFRQFSSFAGVGLVATTAHYCVLIGLVEIAGAQAAPAAVAGSAVGALISYSLNRRHTFRSNLPHRRAGARFAVVASVGLALTYLFMTALVGFCGAPYLLAQVATTGVVVLWTFAAHRIWTFA